MKYIQTVKGPIKPEELGKTLMHEHCMIAETDTYSHVENMDPELREFLNSEIVMENRARVLFYMHKHSANKGQLSEELAIQELLYFKKAGGNTIVDVSGAMTPDPQALVRISDAVGINIVATTGLYSEDAHPECVRKLNKRELTDFFLRELREGIGGTDIRAGYIGEMGMSDDWTPREVEALRAAGAAAAEFGCSMTIHQPIFRTWGDRIVDLLVAEGLDTDKIVLSHCDPTLDCVGYHEGLLERGVRLQFDEFQLEFPVNYGPYVKRWLPRDIDRVRHIKRLCDMGFEDKITVSMDMGPFKPSYRKYGGPGYAYLIDLLYPYFIHEGLTEAQMEKIFVHNPRHILTLEG